MKRLFTAFFAMLFTVALVCALAQTSFAQERKKTSPRREVQGEVLKPQEVPPPQEVSGPQETQGPREVLQKSSCEGLERFGNLPIPNGPPPVYVNRQEINKVLVQPEWTCQVKQENVWAFSLENAMQKFHASRTKGAIILQMQMNKISSDTYEFIFTYIDAGYDRK